MLHFGEFHYVHKTIPLAIRRVAWCWLNFGTISDYYHIRINISTEKYIMKVVGLQLLLKYL